MYEAKAAGHACASSTRRQAQDDGARVALEADMRSRPEAASSSSSFSAQDGPRRITGAEALLRWKHPVKGYIPPSEFIPLAEQSGPGPAHGAMSCARPASGWPVEQPSGAGPAVGAVNVSPRQFHEAGCARGCWRRWPAPVPTRAPAAAELTEGLLLRDVEDTVAKMVQLRGYGAGASRWTTSARAIRWSSQRLPLHELKIDQSFVRDVLTDPNDAAIAGTIVACWAPAWACRSWLPRA